MASPDPNIQPNADAPAQNRPRFRPRSDGRLPLVQPEQLESTPSRADGISAAEEIRLRATACSFIARAGKELQFKQLAIATACVYFHTFFVRFSFKAYDRFEMAAVCLFLAGKVEEQRRKVKDVAEICLMVRNGRRRGPTDPNVLKTVCDSILDRELLLLSVVEFQFHPSHPYQYCMMVLKRVFQCMDEKDAINPDQAGASLSKLVQKEIAQYAWLMINDSLKTTLCLQYKPEPIALACIDAAFRIMNLDREKPIKLRPDWFTEYDATVTAAECMHIWSVLLAVVELESAGHTGDCQVLWEKFRKIVSMAKDYDGLATSEQERPFINGMETDRQEHLKEDQTSEKLQSNTEVSHLSPTVGGLELKENDAGSVRTQPENEGPAANDITDTSDFKLSSQEPVSKKIRTE